MLPKGEARLAIPWWRETGRLRGVITTLKKSHRKKARSYGKRLVRDSFLS